MRSRLIQTLSEVDPATWDALTGENDPFVEHAFLSALEESATVGGDSGWRPLHLLIEDGGELVGALPLYLKGHSYGEYIFDWAWASGASRLGIEYYPKLVSMAPVTPATGQRFLVHPGADRGPVIAALVEGALEAVRATGASSLHLNFLNEAEHAAAATHPALEPRLTFQFHFHNRGYASFDDFLAALRSPARKQIRRERQRTEALGLDIRTLRGEELSARDWQALRAFYQDTCARKGSYPYLTDAFFDILAERAHERVVAVIAYDSGRPVAGTLNFEKGGHLYGRYWGALAEYEMLHFELCYYRLIERSIDRGMRRFEAGAQGAHKLKRGLLPSPVRSLHHIAHPRLSAAVTDFLRREEGMTRMELDSLTAQGPFRRG